MKKIIAFTFAFLTVLTMCGCDKRADYSQKISQLRTEIFIGKTDRFTLYCYGETRETPFETDGKTTEVRPFATFKIIPVTGEACEGEILVRFGAAGLNFCGKFEYKPLADARYAYILLPCPPKENFTAVISMGDEDYSVEMRSLKLADTIDYAAALSVAQKACGADGEKFFNDESYGEIRIRLLENDGYNFWYVGFFAENFKREYLIDGKTAEILATK